MCSDHVIRRCVLDKEISNILQSCHTAAYGGRFGGHETIWKLLQSGYYRPFIFKYVYKFIKCCDRCKRTGNIFKKHEMSLTNILEVELFYVWGIDFIWLFPPSLGNLFILVVVDYVFKWVEVVAFLDSMKSKFHNIFTLKLILHRE